MQGSVKMEIVEKRHILKEIALYENVGGGDENYEKETFIIEIRPYENAGDRGVKSQYGESEIRGPGAVAWGSHILELAGKAEKSAMSYQQHGLWRSLWKGLWEAIPSA